MLSVLVACVLSGALLSVPLIRATRRMEAARMVVRRGDYLRTARRSRLSRVSPGTFAVRL
jgi:hypothetical protein